MSLSEGVGVLNSYDLCEKPMRIFETFLYMNIVDYLI